MHLGIQPGCHRFLHLLRDWRREREITQSQLAAKLGWTQADISKVETGVRRLDVIELAFWMEALGEELLSFVAQMGYDPEHDNYFYTGTSTSVSI